MKKISKNANNLRSHPDPKDLSFNLDIKTYFRQLKLRLRIGLLMAFVLPFMALSVYFHYQFNFTLKERGLLNGVERGWAKPTI